MSDFDMMCAMYDRAEIEYTVDAMANFYADEGKTSRTIKTEADWEKGVCGYRGGLSATTPLMPMASC